MYISATTAFCRNNYWRGRSDSFFHRLRRSVFSLPARTPSRSRLGIQIHRGAQFTLLRGADTHLRKRRKERRKSVIRRGIRDGNRGHTAGRLQNGRCGRGPARSTGVAALRCLGARTSGGTVVEGRVVGRRRRGRELGG